MMIKEEKLITNLSVHLTLLKSLIIEQSKKYQAIPFTYFYFAYIGSTL